MGASPSHADFAAAAADAAEVAPAWLKPGRLLPLLAARLGAALGLKLTLGLAPEGEEAAVAWLTLGHYDCAGDRLWLAIADRDALALLDCAMGGRGDVPDALNTDALQAGCATWRMLAGQFVTAIEPLLAEMCAASVVAVAAPYAEAPPMAGFGWRLRLEHERRVFHLLLAGTFRVRPAPRAEAPAEEAVALEQWQADARSICLDMELPVGARLSEQRMALGDLLALQVGDSIPLPPVKTLKLIVAGQEHGRLPLGGADGPPIEGEWS